MAAIVYPASTLSSSATARTAMPAKGGDLAGVAAVGLLGGLGVGVEGAVADRGGP
jgi:hypothetical protein